MSSARVIDAAPSAAFLPPDSTLRRGYRKPRRPPPDAFLDAYEDRALVYDTFWHADGNRVLLIGPPPIDLKEMWRQATFVARPTSVDLRARQHVSRSQMVIELQAVPPDTTVIEMTSGAHRFELPVGANKSAEIAGRRVLFSMNKDNDLAWIRQWAAHHVRYHGTDSVVLFDNGSSRYGIDDIVEALRGVDGLAQIAVPSWPWRFGRTDERVLGEKYWAHFLQNCSMNVVLRRLGAGAHSLLNVDIDELVWAGEGRSVHDLCKTSQTGFLTFEGQWVESVVAPDTPPDHRRFQTRLKDPKARHCRNRKWILDPSRHWTQSLRLHPYWHWLQNRPLRSKEPRQDVFYWHFRGINTNWKVERTTPSVYDVSAHEVDPILAAFT